MKLTHLVLTSALALAPTALFAQTHIQDRKGDQQQRIANGIDSGQLNAREAGRLEHRERSINQQEARMRSRHDGYLTARERNKLNARQNRTSQAIYSQKHDAQTGVPR